MSKSSTKPTYIRLSTARSLVENSKGRFMGLCFTKKDGSLRTMNCKYLSNQRKNEAFFKVEDTSKLKYRELGESPIRRVEFERLKSITIAGKECRIRK